MFAYIDDYSSSDEEEQEHARSVDVMQLIDEQRSVRMSELDNLILEKK